MNLWAQVSVGEITTHPTVLTVALCVLFHAERFAVGISLRLCALPENGSLLCPGHMVCARRAQSRYTLLLFSMGRSLTDRSDSQTSGNLSIFVAYSLVAWCAGIGGLCFRHWERDANKHGKPFHPRGCAIVP